MANDKFAQRYSGLAERLAADRFTHAGDTHIHVERSGA